MTRITLYGGIKVVGGNKVLVESEGNRLLFDFGQNFDTEKKYYREYLHPRSNGIRDLLRLNILPRIDGLYCEDYLNLPNAGEISQTYKVPIEFLQSDVLSYEKAKELKKPTVDGVFISHGHYDHMGAINHIHPHIPIYCTKNTYSIIEASSEMGYHSEDLRYYFPITPVKTERGYFPGSWFIRRDKENQQPKRFVSFSLWDRQKIGVFDIKSLPVDHSIWGATSYLIRTPDRNIWYSGDFRLHGPQSVQMEGVLNQLSKINIDAMIIEGTRIMEEKSLTESDVEKLMVEKFSECSGLSIVSFSLKDIDRFKTLLSVARKLNKQFVIQAKLAFILHKLNFPLPPDVKVYLKRRMGLIYSPVDYGNVPWEVSYDFERELGNFQKNIEKLIHLREGVRAKDVHENPQKYLLMLTYYDLNELLDINPPPNSMLICSYSEPFNLEMELNEEVLKNWLALFNLNSSYNCQPIHIHSSGHCDKLELKYVLNKLKPKRVIPIHTEYPEKFEELYSDAIIPEYGESIKI